ncbi:serine/threonine-protein kinase OSR1-like [Pieris rapae]|uniref:serine/threonine-protein kinase OSR1-like n=1 Tax=Pieris rapae TaxID=64459 RepID=UPI001E27FCFB|nr:serine/threonine-protein kinase OSR1-like [Pieris rapae]
MPLSVSSILLKRKVRMAALSATSSNDTVTQGAPWPNNEDDYEIGDSIGVGATAVVHSALCKPRNQKCAIKRISLDKWKMSLDELLKEIQVISSCNHENVVTYYTSFVVKEELWLVMKLLEGGSLRDVIKHKMKLSNCKHGVFDEVTIATVLKEVLKGLEYFHNNGKMHRDIKAGNILLGKDGSVQIADFGVSASLGSDKDLSRQKLRHTFVGTPCWMAPEVMEQDKGYDFKADIWSFGITAIELATGAAPYCKYPPMKVLMLTLQNDAPDLDTCADDETQYKTYGKTFRKMINECLQKNSEKRPTATELLKHPFFKKAQDKKYLSQKLVEIGLSMELKFQAQRHSGSSSGLHRTATGQWVWNDSDDDDSDDDVNKPMNEIQNDSSSSDEDEAEEEQNATSSSRKIYNLVLRLRNDRLELNEIKFAFITGKDTSRGIATELVEADLLSPIDWAPIAKNLAQLLLLPESESITFNLISTPTNQMDKEKLIGYAQICIISVECE